MHHWLNAEGTKMYGMHIWDGSIIIGHVSLVCQNSHDNIKLWHLRLMCASKMSLVELSKIDLICSDKLDKLDFFYNNTKLSLRVTNSIIENALSMYTLIFGST